MIDQAVATYVPRQQKQLQPRRKHVVKETSSEATQIVSADLNEI